MQIEDAQAGGGNDGTEASTDTELNSALNESGGGANSDGGSGAGAAQEGGGEEGSALETEAGDGSDQPVEGAETGEDTPAPNPEMTALLQQFAETKAELAAIKAAQEQQQQAKQNQPVQLTEEEWAAREQQWGIPRQAIQSVAAAVSLATQRMEERVEAMLNERVGGFERSGKLAEIAREEGYRDATSPALKSGIETFLKEAGVPNANDPKVLRMAVVYARGLNADKRVAQAAANGGRNGKITGPARPAAPSSGGTRRVGAPAVTDLDRVDGQRTGISPQELATIRARAAKGPVRIEV